MPRPRILRNVHALPKCKTFGPLNYDDDVNIVMMTIEEYETIRLIDDLGLNQSECADELGVGRTTAQRIYNNARKKISECLVHGNILQIEGGNYQIKGQGRGNRGGRHGHGPGQGQGKGRNKRF